MSRDVHPKEPWNDDILGYITYGPQRSGVAKTANNYFSRLILKCVNGWPAVVKALKTAEAELERLSELDLDGAPGRSISNALKTVKGALDHA